MSRDGYLPPGVEHHHIDEQSGYADEAGYLTDYTWSLLEGLTAMLYRGDEIDLEDQPLSLYVEAVAEFDAVTLDVARELLNRVRAASKIISGVLDAALLDWVREHGAIRLGDQGYYAGRKTTKKVTDADGLLRWLLAEGDPYENVRGAVNISERNVRVTALDAIAKSRGHDDASAVIGTFYEVTVEDDAELKAVHASKAKWVERLTHGEVRT